MCVNHDVFGWDTRLCGGVRDSRRLFTLPIVLDHLDATINLRYVSPSNARRGASEDAVDFLLPVSCCNM